MRSAPAKANPLRCMGFSSFVLGISLGSGCSGLVRPPTQLRAGKSREWPGVAREALIPHSIFTAAGCASTAGATGSTNRIGIAGATATTPASPVSLLISCRFISSTSRDIPRPAASIDNGGVPPKWMPRVSLSEQRERPDSRSHAIIGRPNGTKNHESLPYPHISPIEWDTVILCGQ